jgi:hypothetical protein
VLIVGQRGTAVPCPPSAVEARVADAVLAADVGQSRRLPLLVTTVDFLIAADGGPFDPIWRVPGTRASAGVAHAAFQVG